MTDFITLKTFQPESAKQVYDALVAAKTAFDKEEDYVYVLDTNALLKTYSLDSDSFNKLKNYFESNKGKIFATYTVEIEYIRNRESVSNSYAVVSKKKFVDAFNKIGGTIEALYSDPGFDYSYLMKDNKELCEKIKALHEKYKTVSNDVANYEKSISLDDADAFKLECLETIVNNVDFSTKLSEEQYNFLKAEFKDLYDIYNGDKGKNKPKTIPNFPGCGEKNPEKDGDYIIFYEMIELAKAQEKNIMLLTNDVTKDDWVDYNGKTFERYQIMFHTITGHSFIVRKYDDFLKDKIGIEAQVLEESEDSDVRSIGITTMSNAIAANEFSKLYRELERKLIEIMGSSWEKRIRNYPIMFFRHYRACINDDLFTKIIYIVRSRNRIIRSRNEEMLLLNSINFDRAIGYTKELIEALPMIFQAIARNNSVSKQ